MSASPMSGHDRLPAATGIMAAALAASCCLLPLLLIATGLAGAGLMMTTMRYEWLTLPLGVIGLGGAFWSYARERHRCASRRCRFAAERTTQVILGAATAVVIVALLLRLFPSWTASILHHM